MTRESHPPPSAEAIESQIAGFGFCFLAAVGYSATNVFLRQVALGSDPVLAVCIKELVTAFLVGVWLLLPLRRTKVVWPPLRAVALLLAAATLTQFGGNLGIQLGFRNVGLTVAMPTMFAMVLVAAAVFGWVLLDERVARRTMIAIAILIAAVVLLSAGAGAASESVSEPEPGAARWLRPTIGVLAACVAGVCYGGMGAVIRRTVSAAVPPAVVVFLVTATALISLTPVSVARLGLEGIIETPSADLYFMLAAGACNLLAFASITQGLKRINVVHVNIINSSQVAMCAVAGVIVFAEPLTASLAIGVLLTIGGTLLIVGARHGAEDA
ncbi:MAG: DMT family transporter [Planctomycetes bacterium]|nr:DMT family transporter [Planctomycetota bacterium]